MTILICLISFIIISYLLIGFYFLNYTSNPKFSSKKLFKKRKIDFLTNDESKKWFDNIGYNDIYIKSFDGKKLHAYEINNKSNIWIIIIHGYTNNGLEMLSVSKKFYEKGYNVLLLDLRAHGKSEGIFSTGGFYERKDMLEWINYLNDNNKCKIVLYGISMGGTIVMRTIGENLPKNVLCGIEDCGFISNYKQFYDQLSYQKLPAKLIIYSANLFSIVMTGFNMLTFDPIEVLKKGKIPMLFIHGKNDRLVKPNNAIDAYNNYNSEKKLLLVDNAKHMKSSIIESNLYYQTIFDFINKKTDN